MKIHSPGRTIVTLPLLLALFACPAPSTMAQAGVADNPRYRRLSQDAQVGIERFEEQHQSLVDLWVETRDVRERLAEQLMVLGRQRRRAAAQEVRMLERGLKRLESRFHMLAERTRTPYERNFQRLRDQLWQGQQSLNPDNPRQRRQQEQEIDELREESIAIERMLRTLDGMAQAINFDLPRPEETARFPRGTDPQRTYRFLASNATQVLDARMNLLDHLEDLKQMQRDKQEAGADWSGIQENRLSALVEQSGRAWQNLQSQIDRSLRNEYRDKQRLEQEVERLQSRMRGSSGRMQERIADQLREAQTRLANLQAIIDRYQAAAAFPPEYQQLLDQVK